jgi:hypothetical protein
MRAHNVRSTKDRLPGTDSIGECHCDTHVQPDLANTWNRTTFLHRERPSDVRFVVWRRTRSVTSDSERAETAEPSGWVRSLKNQVGQNLGDSMMQILTAFRAFMSSVRRLWYRSLLRGRAASV